MILQFGWLWPYMVLHYHIWSLPWMVENATVCVLIGSLKSYPRERQRFAYFYEALADSWWGGGGKLKGRFLNLYNKQFDNISAVQCFSEVFHNFILYFRFCNHFKLIKVLRHSVPSLPSISKYGHRKFCGRGIFFMIGGHVIMDLAYFF